jgi:23S rRNA pseudouridine1911/1915/1917 synthase
MLKIPILYEESHFMLVNKPSGLFTQAAPGVPSLEVFLSEQLKVRDQHPGRPFVGLPHRLDRATSGVLLVARNQRALSKFGQQFQSRKIGKHYLALVHGVVPSEIQLWSDQVRKIPDVAKAEIVPAGDNGGRLAELRVEGVLQLSDRALVVVELLTGRMHQIRVQFSSRGYPVVGDTLYGAAAGVVDGEVGLAADDSLVDRQAERESPQALHAYRLSFYHPQTAKAMYNVAPLPDHWQAWIEVDREQIAAALDSSRLLAASPVYQP